MSKKLKPQKEESSIIRRLTIKERIDRLIDFVQKYPSVWNLNRGKNIEKTINKYIEQFGEEDIEVLTRLLKTANNDYNYIRVRHSKGKVSEDDIKRLQEAGIGRVIGDSQDLELQKQEFDIDSKAYGLIIKQYGSLEGFKKNYIDALIKGKVKETIDPRILTGCNLVKAFDFSKPDLLCRENENYFDLWKDVYNKNILIADDMSQIVDKTNNIIDNLNADRARTLEDFYGLRGHTKMTRKEITKEDGVGRGTIGIRINRTINQARKQKNTVKDHFIDFSIEEEYIRQFLEEYFRTYGVFVRKEDRELDENIFKELRKNTIDKGLELYKVKKEQIEILRRFNKIELKELYETTARKKSNGLQISDSMLIEILDNDLVQKRIREFEKDRITNKVKGGIYSLTMGIEELDLSVRSYNSLKRVGINTIEDLTYKSYEEIRKIYNLGKKSFEEIVEKLNSMGIELRDEEDADYIEKIKKNKQEKISSMQEMVKESKYLSETEKEELLAKISEKIKDITSEDIGKAGFEVGIGDVEKCDEAQKVLSNLVEKTKEGGIKKDE